MKIVKESRGPGMAPLRLGFTGTREGMTDAQKATCHDLLAALYPIGEMHHGDCVGADADMHAIARSYGGIRIVLHPSTFGSLRANCAGDFACNPLPPLQRNALIVRASEFLIATPKEDHEMRKGGTWRTVRFARALGVDHVIVWPDGSVQGSGHEAATMQSAGPSTTNATLRNGAGVDEGSETRARGVAKGCVR